MGHIENIRIKTWHVLAVIVVFAVLVAVLGSESQSKPMLNDVEDCLVELDGDFFPGCVSSGHNLVLFYVEDSDYCERMKQNLSRIADGQPDEVGFYKLNLDKYPELNKQYNISGVPNILIFRDSVELKRVMGVVSESNLKRIYQKTVK